MRKGRKRVYRRARPPAVPRKLSEDGQRACIFCGVREGNTREHIVPNSRLKDRHNWAKEGPCCQVCNGAKGSRLPTDAEFEAFERFWHLEIERLRLELAELRLVDAQMQCRPAHQQRVAPPENIVVPASMKEAFKAASDAVRDTPPEKPRTCKCGALATNSQHAGWCPYRVNVVLTGSEIEKAATAVAENTGAMTFPWDTTGEFAPPKARRQHRRKVRYVEGETVNAATAEKNRKVLGSLGLDKDEGDE